MTLTLLMILTSDPDFWHICIWNLLLSCKFPIKSNWQNQKNQILYPLPHPQPLVEIKTYFSRLISLATQSSQWTTWPTSRSSLRTVARMSPGSDWRYTVMLELASSILKLLIWQQLHCLGTWYNLFYNENWEKTL